MPHEFALSAEHCIMSVYKGRRYIPPPILHTGTIKRDIFKSQAF